MGVEGRLLGEVVVAETQGGADHMPNGSLRENELRNPPRQIFFVAEFGSPHTTSAGASSHQRKYRPRRSSYPKQFFKELFFGTTIGYRFKKMTKRNGVVKGLRDQECERGNIAKRPLIPYVPVTDEVQDADLSQKLP